MYEYVVFVIYMQNEPHNNIPMYIGIYICTIIRYVLH